MLNSKLNSTHTRTYLPVGSCSTTSPSWASNFGPAPKSIARKRRQIATRTEKEWRRKRARRYQRIWILIPKRWKRKRRGFSENASQATEYESKADFRKRDRQPTSSSDEKDFDSMALQSRSAIRAQIFILILDSSIQLSSACFDAPIKPSQTDLRWCRDLYRTSKDGNRIRNWVRTWIRTQKDYI